MANATMPLDTAASLVNSVARHPSATSALIDSILRLGMQAFHQPVMLREVLELLDLGPGDSVVDGTVGLGGHSISLVEQIAPGGKLLGMDLDQEMVAHARARLAGVPDVDLNLVNDDFRTMTRHARERALTPNGILLDLGLNSAQIADSARGIAFTSEGPLDMRMDRSRGEPAAALLNRLSLGEIEDILFNLGDERWARAIAKEIVLRRTTTAIRTTNDLVDAVLAAVPAKARDRRIHPATRTFQALRIAVNRELEGLDDGLADAARLLASNGVMVVLSYHSGEDRIVKQTFRALADGGDFVDLTRKPIQPTAGEIIQNRRSRSAKLRAIKRI